MAQYALEIEVATCDFEIGVADTGLQDTDEGFAFHEGRVGIVLFKRQGIVSVNQSAHRLCSLTMPLA